MKATAHFGTKLRALRRQAGLTQAGLAERLGISTSYVNLLESGRRPVTAELLLNLARTLDVDLRSLSTGPDAQLLSDAMEVFGDGVLDDHPLTGAEVRELVETMPSAARAVVHLHRSYVAARSALEALQARLLDDPELLHDVRGVDRARLSSEQVTDYMQRRSNHFPALEAAAERVWSEGGLEASDLYGGLRTYLARRHDLRVRVLPVREMGGAVVRFVPDRHTLELSEALPRGSRNFQLAVRVGLLECRETIAALVDDAPELTSDEARALARVALANYFAGALLMPYDAFLRAAEQERYDIEILGHRFDVEWEQTCHRLTTLRRPGAEGVAFYFVRVDMAGNISKRLSAAGVQIPRFSGLCALWNVHAAFMNPGRVNVQLSSLPDGRKVLSIAQTVQRHAGGYHSPDVLYAVGIGCDSTDAPRLVYGDGLDLTNDEAAVPVGITCRLCERAACRARAFPALHRPLRLDENVRGLSFYAPVPEDARTKSQVFSYGRQ